MAGQVPIISVTNSTPPRPAEALNPSVYRLLYRGALSLPDSHLVLDGLTFSARLESPSKHNNLLQNPLALALESMRGRPSLRFLGVVKLDDDNLWLDDSGEIELDIHPRATLSRIYFENTFCLASIASTSKSASVDSLNTGVQVALGDSGKIYLNGRVVSLTASQDGPETTQIVIFSRRNARLSDNPGNDTIQLIVARITPRPPPHLNLLRLPRPDDPTPRKPPISFSNENNFPKRELKRIASTSSIVSERELKRVSSITRKRKTAKFLGGSVITDLGSGARLGDETKGTQVLFKVPELPPINEKGKMKMTGGEHDVFGSTVSGTSGSYGKDSTEKKGKRKRDHDEGGIGREGLPEMERENKNVIKRCAVVYLSKTKDPSSAVGIDKSHPEFKEIFGWVYRGVAFALRAQIRAKPVDTGLVEQLVKNHTSMYIGGNGGI